MKNVARSLQMVITGCAFVGLAACPASPTGNHDSGIEDLMPPDAAMVDMASSPKNDMRTTTTDGGAVPTTCAGAHGSVGCCSPDDKVNYYCSGGGSTVTIKTCNMGSVCGWNAPMGYYTCVAPPGGPDPTGRSPIACD